LLGLAQECERTIERAVLDGSSKPANSKAFRQSAAATASRDLPLLTTRQVIMERQAMDQKTFSVLAGAIFALVALLHALRIYMGWPILIGAWNAPMWLSWIGLVVTGGLSYFGLTLGTRS
jgi:hypothetical protein